MMIAKIRISIAAHSISHFLPSHLKYKYQKSNHIKNKKRVLSIKYSFHHIRRSPNQLLSNYFCYFLLLIKYFYTYHKN